MRSSIPPSLPDTPQADDIQAIQFYYTGASVPCVADATTLCANGNRFKIQTQYNTPNSITGGGPGTLSARTSGAGQAVSLTSDTGYFWFFSSGNASSGGTTTLCTTRSRITVGGTWTMSAATSGAGQAVPITSDTGYFWFFSSANVEMVIKVVDGRPLNSRFWVFAGGLTNVKV